MEKKFSTFNDFGLSDDVLKAVAAMGFEAPTPIQEKTIPMLLTGKDVIGQAQTGTGKTAAFGIPIVERTHRSPTVQALILAPTRELAIQAAEELNKLGKFKKLQALPVYGGTSIERQIRAIKKGVHIVVGTPGRIIDHLERKTLSLKDVKIAVLDEADEMLDMGFIDDIEKILRHTPPIRQTMLFSATMPDGVLKIAKRYMRTPEKIRIASDTLAPPMIDQVFYEVREAEKTDVLSRLIDSCAEGRFLVFCHTKKDVDEVSLNLKLRGYSADAMHGDFSQSQRESVLRKFKDSKIDVLVATDVAARGLDISAISHVVNYSIPQNPESYVHRIGRTGRAGKTGAAVTFVTPREERQLKIIMAVSKANIKRGKLPSREDVAMARLSNLKEKIQEFIDDKRFDKFLKLAEEVTKEVTPMEALASLLKFQLEGFTAEITSAGAGAGSLDDTGARPGMARLFMTVGRAEGIKANDIANEISKKAGIPKTAVEKISIFDTFTFVEVPREAAEKVIEFMHQSIMSGRKVMVSPAKPRGK